jgi:hypothetical protein
MTLSQLDYPRPALLARSWGRPSAGFPLVELGFGVGWGPEYLTVGANRALGASEHTQVDISTGDGAGFEMTPPEARQFAAAILATCDDLEAGQR